MAKHLASTAREDFTTRLHRVHVDGKDDGEFEVPLSAAAYVAVSDLWSIASLRVAMPKMFRSSSEATTVIHPKKLHPNREFARLFSSYAKSKSSFEGFLLG
ncbi:unnamed protein product [Musa acuminata subsp. burmannicoides]